MKTKKIGWMMAAALLSTPVVTSLAQAENYHDAGVYFVSPHDGATLTSPVEVAMGVWGMEAVKAGKVEAGKGHHHLLVDSHFVTKSEGVAKDATHLHFGKGQSKTSLKLTPGYHTLTLQFADGHHHSYGGKWSRTIQVLVK